MLGWIGRMYGEAAWRRRQWYANRSDARRRLRRPVISIGALTVGGSGKTPLTALVARTLVALGERPAVLSRGHGRTDAVAGADAARCRGRGGGGSLSGWALGGDLVGCDSASAR